MNKTTNLPLRERLKNGARKLGDLWRQKAERCDSGWALDPCKCQPTKKFCQAKNLWVTLAIDDWLASLKRGDQDGREMDDGPFGVAVSMTSQEWDETQVLMKVVHPQIGEILVGTAKDKMTRMQDLANMLSTPDELKDILMVMKTFPNSRVMGVEDAAPAAVIIEEVLSANPDEAFE